MCSRSSSFDSKLIQGERAIIVLKQESCQAISENNSCTAYTTDKKTYKESHWEKNRASLLLSIN